MSKYITKNADRYDPIDRFSLYFSGYPNRLHDRAAMISQIFSPHRNSPNIQKNGLPNLDFFKSNFRRPLNLTEGSKIQRYLLRYQSIKSAISSLTMPSQLFTSLIKSIAVLTETMPSSNLPSSIPGRRPSI